MEGLGKKVRRSIDDDNDDDEEPTSSLGESGSKNLRILLLIIIFNQSSNFEDSERGEIGDEFRIQNEVFLIKLMESLGV